MGMFFRMFSRLAASAAIVVAVVACSTASVASPPAESQAPADSETPMGSGMEEEEEEIGALGELADPASADRTVHITASDALTFEPSSIDVALGETITFEIENVGQAKHELVLGSADFQQQHEQEMQSGSDMGMEMDEPNEVELEAGETASLTWHFTEAGTTQFGCHEPGHYAGGMYGLITVSG